MKRKFWLQQLPMALIALALVIIAAAWQTNPGNNNKTTKDTIPGKVRDIEDALAELEKAKAELERTLGEKKWESEMRSLDAAKIRAQIDEAMKEVDAARIQAEVQRSLAQVDFEKIKKELQESLGKMENAQVKEEMEKALKTIDAARIQAEVDASLARVDVEKIKAEMERAKTVDLKKMEEELKNIGPKIEQSMKEARESMEKARKELTEFKGFIESLHKDGLINKNEPYKVQYENGELTINGKKQPAEVLNQYQGFLKDRRDFTIKKEKDDFNIEMND
ncbi:MAG TPA: hypothetical protein VGC29_04155 [Flavisolibacter sp.]